MTEQSGTAPQGGYVGQAPAGQQIDPQAPATTSAMPAGGQLAFAGDQADLGRAAVEDGAGAQGVSQQQLDDLMAEFRKLQEQVNRQDAERAAAAKGDAGKYAAALQGHLMVTATTGRTAEAAEDHAAVLDLAQELVGATSKDGDASAVPGLLDRIERWFGRHARRHSTDLSYVRDLADEVRDAHEADEGRELQPA
jgi:hypothetical protein